MVACSHKRVHREKVKGKNCFHCHIVPGCRQIFRRKDSPNLNRTAQCGIPTRKTTGTYLLDVLCCTFRGKEMFPIELEDRRTSLLTPSASPGGAFCSTVKSMQYGELASHTHMKVSFSPKRYFLDQMLHLALLSGEHSKMSLRQTLHRQNPSLTPRCTKQGVSLCATPCLHSVDCTSQFTKLHQL